MSVYIITATISCLIIWLEEKVSDKFKKSKKLLLCIAIIIPACIAGMRADTIGTDVRTYVEPLQYFANSCNNFNEYINYSGTLYNGQHLLRFEKGYLSLIYICSRLDKGLFLNFFASEVIILSTLIAGLYKFNKKYRVSLCLSFFIFLTLFYNSSFNLVRQCIAIFILFYGFNFLIRKEWIKYIITIVIAMLFHNSAIIGVLFLLIYWFLYGRKEKRKSKTENIFNNNYLKIICIAIVGLILTFMPIVMKRIFSSSPLFAQYLGYIPDTISLSISQLVVKLPFLIIILIEWKSMKDNPLRYFYLLMAIIDILFSQFSGYSALSTASAFAGRISAYTSAFYIYSVPNALMLDVNKNRKIILMFVLILFLIVYWYHFTIVLNYNETFPYVFSSAYFK